MEPRDQLPLDVVVRVNCSQLFVRGLCDVMTWLSVSPFMSPSDMVPHTEARDTDCASLVLAVVVHLYSLE